MSSSPLQTLTLNLELESLHINGDLFVATVSVSLDGNKVIIFSLLLSILQVCFAAAGLRDFRVLTISSSVGLP